jgi:hypothetical protein
VENNRKPEIANLKFRPGVLHFKNYADFAPRLDCQNARHLACASANYRDRAKILLAMRFHSGKSGQHEMCSSVYSRFLCACVAGIGGFATAFSGQTGATF